MQKKYLIPCTAKCLCYELVELQAKETELTLDIQNFDTQRAMLQDSHSIQAELKTVRERKNEVERLLDRPIITPQEQSEVAMTGNGVKVLLSGEQVIEKLLDNVLTGKSKNILTIESPLGSLLHGKPVGYKGQYSVGRNKVQTFELLEIWPYSKAKKLLKSENGIPDTELQPTPSPITLSSSEMQVSVAG